MAATFDASAADTVRRRRHEASSDKTLEAVDQKAAVRLVKHKGEWRRLCSAVRAKIKVDREHYFNQLADKAEEPNNNQLNFCSMWPLSRSQPRPSQGSSAQSTRPMASRLFQRQKISGVMWVHGESGRSGEHAGCEKRIVLYTKGR